MADTIRDRTTLLANMPVGTARGISAQDIRDMLVSVHGVYGCLYTQDGAAPQSLTPTPAKLTGWASVGNEAGVTGSHGDDELVVGTAGIYLVSFYASVTVAADVKFQLRLRIDGVEAAGAGCSIEAAAGTYGVSFALPVSLAANQVLTIYGESDEAGGANLTLVDGQFLAHRIA
jgi:hypothetical protein